MKPRAIHQFHSGSAYGDGITNGMFFIRKILRESGYCSEIYCVHGEPRYEDEIRSFLDYQDNPQNLLLVHYSLGTFHNRWISDLRSLKVLVYHNITPEYYFPVESDLRLLADQGRHQLAQWATERHFRGAIADSAFNADELVGWGYAPIAPIGLLVDLDRIRNHA